MKQIAMIPVGQPWNSPYKQELFTTSYSYVPSPGKVSSGTIKATRTTSLKQRVTSGSALKYDGWREPTIFRGYVAKMTPKSGSFNYDCIISGKPGNHNGPHYSHSNNVVFAGMEGAGHYPIDNGSANSALQKAKASLDKADLQLGVALAELSLSFAMLTKVVTDLRHYMETAMKFLTIASNYRRHIVQMVLRTSATRSGRRKIAGAIGKAAASRWLEYQYGWRPLMSDIYGIAGLIDEQCKQKLSIVGKSDDRSGASSPFAFTPNSLGCLMFANPKIMSGAYARLDWEVSNSTFRMFNRLGLTNILSIGWELIPFSFVIDWIAPVGNYLASLAAGWGLTYLGGSITTYTTANIDVTWTQYPFLGGEPIQYKLESVSWFRYPVSENSLGTSVYAKSPFSVTRAVTSLALLTQLMSKKG